MSIENLKEYARRCATEPELRARAKALGLSDIEGHIREAGSLGLDWTSDDLDAFRKEVIDAEGDLDDLSEEELEQVAGGIVSSTAALAVGVAVGVGVGAGVVVGGVVAGATAGASVAGNAGW